MKKLSVIFAIIAFFATGIMQAQKIASLDYEAVLTAMPEAKKMSTDLEAFSKAKGDELNKQAAAFQAEVEAYQKSAGTLTEAQRAAKEEELRDKPQSKSTGWSVDSSTSAVERTARRYPGAENRITVRFKI